MGKVVQFPKQGRGIDPPDIVQVKFSRRTPCGGNEAQWVELIDLKGGDVIMRRPIREVGKWLNEHGFSYAMGSMAIWYRDYFKLRKRETLYDESKSQ
jgi:hypothetical protein